MVRTPCRDERGLRKGTWTPEEDSKLIDYVTKHGCWNWRQLPNHAGLSRCGKSCRRRWMNYLRPNIRRGNYSKEEDDLIMKLHESHGNRWSVIAAHLPGRTDNEVKNHWHTLLKHRLKQTTIIHQSKYDSYNTSNIHGITNLGQKSEPKSSQFDHEIVENYQISRQSSSRESLSSTINNTNATNCPTFVAEDNVLPKIMHGEFIGDFWTQSNMITLDPEPLFPSSIFVGEEINYHYEYMFDEDIEGLQW